MSYKTTKPQIAPPADACQELEAELVAKYINKLSHITPDTAAAVGVTQLYSSISRLPDDTGRTLEMRLGTVNVKQPLNTIVDRLVLGISHI